MKNMGSGLAFLLILFVSFCVNARDSQSLFRTHMICTDCDAMARSFIEINYIGTEEASQKRIASPEWVRFYQKLLSDIETHRSSLESQWMEFLHVYFEELHKRDKQGLSMRPHGNKHTIYTYLALVKSEVMNRIPENVFLLGYLKYSSAFSPISYVENELEKIYRPHFAEYKFRSPSIARLTEMMSTWIGYQFQQYLKTTPLQGKVKDMSAYSTISNTEIVETIKEYGRFYNQFLRLDSNSVIYGHRSNPGYTGAFRLSTMKPPKGGNVCDRFF